MTAYSPDPRDLARGARLGAAIRPARVRGTDDATPRVPRRRRAIRAGTAADGRRSRADEILDALADDVMADGDLAEALRRLMERGWRTGDPTRGDMAGLRDLIERLERRREELLDRHGLGDVLGEIRAELDEIVATSGPAWSAASTSAAPRRRTVPTADAPDPAPQDCFATSPPERLDQLDALPDDVGERIRGLQDYDFLEPERARAVRRARRAAPAARSSTSTWRDVRADPVDDARRISARTARWSATSTS